MELLLIVGHDPLDAVGVEVSGDLGQRIPRFGKLEQGPLEQVMIVRLELNTSPVPEYLPVASEEGLGS